MSDYRNSKQRLKIIDILKSTEIHPTADWIYEKLKKEFPNLSLGTVYRNLNILVDMGMVDRLDFGKTFDRFEAKIDKHYHFICESCGSILDLDIDKQFDNKLEETVKTHTKLKIKTHKVQFYGICEKCLNKK